jgi:hypothetical protein
MEQDAPYGQPQAGRQPPQQRQRFSYPQPYTAPSRRRSGYGGWGYSGWVAIGAVVLVAVAGGAFWVLHSRAAGKPLTCAQQYANWKNGPANAGGKQVAKDASALSTAGRSEDIAEMDADLKAIGTDATALEAYPMPQCADPAGYWMQYLADMKAAGDNAGTGSGLGGLLLAEAPLKNLSSTQSKLSAELAKTAGVKAS